MRLETVKIKNKTKHTTSKISYLLLVQIQMMTQVSLPTRADPILCTVSDTRDEGRV